MSEDGKKKKGTSGILRAAALGMLAVAVWYRTTAAQPVPPAPFDRQHRFTHRSMKDAAILGVGERWGTVEVLPGSKDGQAGAGVSEGVKRRFYLNRIRRLRARQESGGLQERPADKGMAETRVPEPEGGLARHSLPSPLAGYHNRGSNAGARLHPIYRTLLFHNGTDFPCNEGTPVVAVMDGYVTFSGWMGGYGNIIVVRHRNNLETKYGHLSKRYVALGDRVAEGTVLGASGATGRVTGPHLHFELISDGIVLDPMDYVR